MTKLPVWATVTEAYRATWAQRWLLLRFAVAPLVLAVLLAYFAMQWRLRYEPWPGDGGSELSLWPEVAGRFVMFLGQAAVLPFLVQGFRTFLLGAPAVAGDGPFRIGPESLWLAALTLVLFLLLFRPYLFQWPHVAAGWILGLQYWSGEQHLEFFILGSMLWIMLWALLVRLAFVYPAVSLGKSLSLGDRWRETEGNFWRLCGVFAVSLWPILLSVYVYHQLRFRLWPSCDLTDGSEGRAGLFCHLQWLFDQMIAQAILFASGALWAAVTAVAYATLTGYPAKGLGVPPAREGPA